MKNRIIFLFTFVLIISTFSSNLSGSHITVEHELLNKSADQITWVNINIFEARNFIYRSWYDFCSKVCEA